MSDAPFLNETFLAPISEASPAGQDVSYDTDFEKLAAELEKVTSVSGEAPDWNFIRRESSRILKEVSKDLRVASWWVASAGMLEGWNAVAEGLATYKAFFDRFWNEMYPPLKRVRARAGLVGWLWEQLARSLAPRNVTIADGDAVRASEAAISALDSFLSEKVGDANPGVAGLRTVMREKIRSIPEAPKAADPFAAPTAAQPTGAQGGSPPQSLRSLPSNSSNSFSIPEGAAAPQVGSVGSLDAAEATADGWRSSLSTLAVLAREAAPTAPWPYRLMRVATWLTVQNPPIVEEGKTFVRGPRQGDRADFQTMFENSVWEGLRNACEEALSANMFWLDLHRWSAIALENLGTPYAAAREAIGRETVSLVSRLPSLPSLFFSDGTPFASAETADWLVAEQARYGGGGGGGRSPADEASKALLTEAEARVTAGQIDEGLAQAITLANNAPNAAMRFRALLLAGQLAHQKGKSPLALALLERLLPQVDATLEAWEPDVCASFFETALKVTRAVLPDAADRQSVLFRRLLQVDPAAALRIG